jgi:hypothetical protein
MLVMMVISFGLKTGGYFQSVLHPIEGYALKDLLKENILTKKTNKIKKMYICFITQQGEKVWKPLLEIN